MSKDRLPKLELVKNPDQNKRIQPQVDDIVLEEPRYFENRELSHFKFNLRVLS